MALGITGLNGTLNQTIAVAVRPETATAINTLKPLVVLLLGITVYALFIFKFYRFLAARDILKLKLHKRYGWHEGFFQKTFKLFFYLLEHVIMVPVLIFFWFAVMTALLLLLSKNTPEQVMIAAMAIVGAIRITAYYNEELSKDLAKMIPFALLGVFLVDMTFISFSATWGNAKQLVFFVDKLLFYLVFVAGLELLMRIIHLVRQTVKPSGEEPDKDLVS